MKKLPKNCLTCVFMDFVDDELEELRCFHTLNMINSVDGKIVEDTDICEYYKLNKSVEQDANQGCW